MLSSLAGFRWKMPGSGVRIKRYAEVLTKLNPEELALQSTAALFVAATKREGG